MEANTPQEITIEGIGASPGIAHGRAFVVAQSELELPQYHIDPSQRDAEVARFEQSLVTTRQQITKMQHEVARTLGEDEARIFDAHFLVLQDPAIMSETIVASTMSSPIQ